MGRLARQVTSAEAIAAVVADIRRGRVHQPAEFREITEKVVAGVLLARAQLPQPVVDATGIYRGLRYRADSVGINLYSDFPSAVSPWPEALIAYVNRHGNVLVMQVHSEPWSDDMRWSTPNPVDWGRVRWIVESSAWIGGHDQTGAACSTQGPVHVFHTAVYGDGEPADLRWIALLKQHNEHVWEMPRAVLSATLNFMACSNIEIAEPKRTFPVRQRLRRFQVPVQTIVVRPPGRRSADAAGQPDGRPMDELDTAVTSVRGRFNHYGPRYGRGLLFGKLEGKFWIPAHARGPRADGAEPPVRDYELRPGLGPLDGTYRG